jgi:hypothetical protein
VTNISNKPIDPYEAHAGEFHFMPEDVVKATRLPTNGTIPRIIGWSGPARAGTTAMLLLLAGHPQVDRVYFQPQKLLLRKGAPAFELYASDKLVCMKEVFGFRAGENYDPIDMLLRAGVPPENITWISFLRDPLLSFASWRHINPTDPEVFNDTQAYAIDHFYKYRQKGIKMVPFVYDLLENNEEAVVKALLRVIGLESTNFSLRFDADQIEKKLVKGQAAEKEYFDYNVKDTYQRKRYTYCGNNYQIPSEMAAAIEAKCRRPYNKFLSLAKAELQL